MTLQPTFGKRAVFRVISEECDLGADIAVRLDGVAVARPRGCRGCRERDGCCSKREEVRNILGFYLPSRRTETMRFKHICSKRA